MRRCLSIIAIVGQFAIQLASVPHAHAGMSAAERQIHNTVPHFHFHCDCSAHNHDHGGLHQAHPGGGHRHECPTDSSNATPTEGWTVERHDATAIHCTGSAISASMGQYQAVAASLLAGIGTLAHRQLLAELDPSGGGFERGQPPDEVLDGSNLYLTMRNLRL